MEELIIIYIPQQKCVILEKCRNIYPAAPDECFPTQQQKLFMRRVVQTSNIHPCTTEKSLSTLKITIKDYTMVGCFSIYLDVLFLCHQTQISSVGINKICIL